MKPIYINEALHRKLKMLCIRNGSRMYALAERAVGDLIAKLWNKSRGKKAKK